MSEDNSRWLMLSLDAVVILQAIFRITCIFKIAITYLIRFEKKKKCMQSVDRLVGHMCVSIIMMSYTCSCMFGPAMYYND